VNLCDQDNLATIHVAMSRDQQQEDRLKELPNSPGVYLMKDAQGDVIYAHKA